MLVHQRVAKYDAPPAAAHRWFLTGPQKGGFRIIASAKSPGLSPIYGEKPDKPQEKTRKIHHV